MKIISFNIGIKIDNAKIVADYLIEQNSDVICLQEVIRPLESSVSPMYRSEEIILESLKKYYPYYFFAPEWVADKHIGLSKFKNFGGMVEQGKLVLSKFPIVHGYNYFYYKNYEFDCDRTKFYEGNDHGRALQVCDIDINGTLIQIGNVHGCYSSDKLDTKESLIQSNFIIKQLKERRIPTILIGDFNVLPNTKSIEIINKEYKNLNTIFNITNTRSKGQEIDYVFIDDNFIEKDLRVDMIEVSDHYPLIAELELKAR